MGLWFSGWKKRMCVDEPHLSVGLEMPNKVFANFVAFAKLVAYD